MGRAYRTVAKGCTLPHNDKVMKPEQEECSDAQLRVYSGSELLLSFKTQLHKRKQIYKIWTQRNKELIV